MKILVLSFYYPPDLSAGSFRTVALVEALIEQSSSNLKVEVITTLPNRYSSFSSQAQGQENDGQLHIRRVRLPEHYSGMVDQAKAFSSYAREVFTLTKGQKYDLVYATSSRLMTAVLGAWISRRLNIPLYLDVRDIFVDTIKDVLSGKGVFLFKPIFSVLERWTINRALHVNLVSQGFEPYFKKRYPKKSFSFFTNGIDEAFLRQKIRPSSGNREASRPISVLYAGNIGEGQGLHAIIPALAQQLGERVEFKLIGDGGRRPQLKLALAGAGVSNVELVTPMSRTALFDEYLAADVLFLHLNDYDAFKKVLPSKIFEYAAMGTPIWAGVSGYAAQFLRKEVSNVAVFSPCDVEQAITVFERLDLRAAPRDAFVQRFSRKRIMRMMAADVLACMGKRAVS